MFSVTNLSLKIISVPQFYRIRKFTVFLSILEKLLQFWRFLHSTLYRYLSAHRAGQTGLLCERLLQS